MRVPLATGIDALAFAFRIANVLPTLAAQAGMTYVSRAAHGCVHRHVVAAHDLAGAVRRYMEWRERARERTWPAGPWHVTAAITDGMHRVAIDAWTNTADQFGRTFGHKAFAFPVHPSHR